MSYLTDLLGEAYKEGMTEDEISAALEKKNQGDTAEITRLKNALNKANTEAAEYKKQLRGKQSEEEAKEAERKAEYEKVMAENAELKRSKNIADRKAKLLGLGYEEKLAEETATAMIDGDLDKVLTNQGTFLEAQKKAIEQGAMRKTPRPAAGGSDGSDDSGVDWDKKITEAQERGSLADVAYFTRLKAMEEQAMNKPDV